MIRRINFVNLFLVLIGAFILAFGTAFSDSVATAKDWNEARMALIGASALGIKAVGVALMGFLTQRDKPMLEGEED